MMGSSSVSASDWVKGIALSIAASIIGGASKLAIRKSWLIEQERNATSASQTQYLTVDEETVAAAVAIPVVVTTANGRCPLCLRLAGMFGMTFLNPLCGVLAMNYASPSILAPFSGLTLVWIVLFSNQLIGERPSSRQVLAAALIVLGEVIVAVFGDHTNDAGVDVEEVHQSYHETPFLLFFASSILWFALLGKWMTSAESPALKRFAWGVSGGSLTAYQNFLKDSLTLVKAVRDEELENSSSTPWALLVFLIVMAIATAFGGLLLLTACMKRYDATYSAAMFVGSFVVSASIMSAIHYDTFQHLTHFYQLALYPTGLLVLIGGVYMLLFPEDQPRNGDGTMSLEMQRIQSSVLELHDQDEADDQDDSDMNEDLL